MPKQKKKFDICVRALIQKEGKILVCYHKKKNYYFFPGGHIEFGERAKDALFRELKEELDLSIKKITFVGIVENFYQEDKENHHEINFVFKVEVKNVKDNSKENHIDFFFLDLKDFAKKDILPLALKKAILNWLKNKKIFWEVQFP